MKIVPTIDEFTKMLRKIQKERKIVTGNFSYDEHIVNLAIELNRILKEDDYELDYEIEDGITIEEFKKEE